MPANDIWLTTDKASAALGITNRTLYRLVDEGKLPGYKMGRVFRFKRADVDAYVESCRIQPGELRHLYPSSEEGADGGE